MDGMPNVLELLHMSSEESVDDGSFTIHPLPWRSEKVTTRNGLQTPEETVQVSLVMTFQRNEVTLPSD